MKIEKNKGNEQHKAIVDNCVESAKEVCDEGLECMSRTNLDKYVD